MTEKDEPAWSQRFHEAQEDLSLRGPIEVDEDIAAEDNVDGTRKTVAPGQQVEPLKGDLLS